MLALRSKRVNYGFMDFGLWRQRFSGFTVAIIVSLLFICVAAPLIEPRGVNALANLRASSQSSSSDDNPNVIAAGAAALVHGTGHAINTAGVKLLGGGVAVIRGITAFDKGTAATADFIVSGTA